jgi:ATP-dependent Clp protease adaptor protein ClpS
MSTELDIEAQIDEAIKELIEPTKSIILYNDNHNTFEHVIKYLMKYCEHNHEQAEQCTLTVHFNGKCDIKKGSEVKLKPIYEALLDKGLKVKIEK